MSTTCCATLLTVAIVLGPTKMIFGHQRGDEEQFNETAILPAGMVADPKREVGFVPLEYKAGQTYKNYISAVDLQTGQVLWSTEEEATPLLVAGDRLLALTRFGDRANTRQMVVLNVSAMAKGRRVLVSQSIGVPSSLMSMTPEALVDKGDLLLKWEAAVSWDLGKIGRGTRFYKEARRINLTSGRVDNVPWDALPAPKLPKAVEAVKSRDRYSLRGPLQTDPLILGTKVAAVFELAETKQETLKRVLRRWDLVSGKELEPTVLVESGPCRIKVTPDQRFVCVRLTWTKEELAEKRLDDDWRVFSVETGKLVGRFPWEPNTREVGVLGSRLFRSFEGENIMGARYSHFLRVQDVKSGKLLWKLALPDLRGP